MREVRLHDTLTGSVRAIEPRDPPRVGIYACGPTVYGRVHVGNARPYVLFALLRRFLEHEGYDPTLVVNVTDVNDKIYDAAREQGVSSEALARAMTAAYVEDTDRLGLGRPDSEPKASETIEAIVALIADLVESGHAYEAGGDVYFSVPSFGDYGKLSNRPTEEMRQGEGDDAAALKRAPQDFALWKATKEGEDTSWSSPWGEGRPGWHIECSAMAEELLGVDFEVHGGGSDLVFPHHENEIAQTEAARGRPLARLWMHNGMVEMGAEKMAKSVGNIRLLHGALDEYGPEAILMWLVSAHYRKPIGYSEEALAQAEANVRTHPRACAPAGPGGAPPGTWTTWPSASSTRWPTTSTPRRPAPSSSSGWARPIAASRPASASGRGVCARCCTRSGSSGSWTRRTRRPPRRFGSWPIAGRRLARRATSPRRTGCATSWRSRAGRSATPRTAPASSALSDRLRPQPRP